MRRRSRQLPDSGLGRAFDRVVASEGVLAIRARMQWRRASGVGSNPSCDTKPGLLPGADAAQWYWQEVTANGDVSKENVLVWFRIWIGRVAEGHSQVATLLSVVSAEFRRRNREAAGTCFLLARPLARCSRLSAGIHWEIAPVLAARRLGRLGRPSVSWRNSRGGGSRPRSDGPKARLPRLPTAPTPDRA